MSIAEIEAELLRLSPDELRQVALKSWAAFVEKEGLVRCAKDCSEDDPELLAALDQAAAEADSHPDSGHFAAQVRVRLHKWISK